MIYENILNLVSNNLRMELSSLTYTYLNTTSGNHITTTTINPPTTSDQPLSSYLPNLLTYITSTLLTPSTYIQHQSSLLLILSKYMFRSPLNFIMVRHDFSLFLGQFLTCRNKLKYGLNFVRNGLLLDIQAKVEVGEAMLTDMEY